MPVVCRHPRSNPDPACAHCQVCLEAAKPRKIELPQAAESATPAEPDYVVDHNRIVIEHGAGGIGDGLLLTLAVNQLREDFPERTIELRVGAVALPFVELFDCCDVLGVSSKIHTYEPVHGALQANRGYEQESKTRLAVPRGERYRKNIGASGLKKPSLKEPKRIRDLRRRYTGFVALCPFSTDRTREWSLQHWLTLERLLLEAGYQCVLLHTDEGQLTPFKSERFCGKPADEVASVCLNACAVIGTDSGIAHLGGMVDTPTIVLGGGTDVSQIFAYPSCRFIQGGLSCSNCCGSSKLVEARCHQSCANLQSITPERVLLELDRIWLKGVLCERSLVDTERLQVLRRELLRVQHLPGDVGEIGVFQGGSAKLLAHFAPRAKLHLFDTFTGIPSNDPTGYGHQQGDFATSLDEVRSYVASPYATYHVGVFPGSLRDERLRLRFLHVDTDILTPEMLERIKGFMSPGGVVVVDDDGWHMCPTVAPALRKAFKPEQIEHGARFQAIVRF